MDNQQDTHHITVTWRGKKFVLEMDSSATLKELGHKLQELTDVKEDTIRLIVPSYKTPKLLSPFTDGHSSLCLQEMSIFEGKIIRMMGVPKGEVDQVLQDAKADMRIAGFDEEEKRLRQRMLNGTPTKLTLPQGTYIFCGFRTLSIPGLQLNPPPSEALKIMHMLAADPGIVAIMNKHRWRVEIMTEMAPEGYVGISPKCILGFNKNHGEEISLRLRTDDLKGFRKYDSIKKTLLHELAHMVFSEHDANFKALDSQLNQEAATLDWTRSRSHTLSETKYSQKYEEGTYGKNVNTSSQKLGGEKSNQLANARASSVVAAYLRLANGSNNSSEVAETHKEPDPGLSGVHDHTEPDPEDHSEPDPDDSEVRSKTLATIETKGSVMTLNEDHSEPDPGRSRVHDHTEPDHEDHSEPDPDDSEVLSKTLSTVETKGTMMTLDEPDPDDSEMNEVLEMEPDHDLSEIVAEGISRTENNEPDPDDEDLRRIQDPVTVICNRLQKAIETLKSEVSPSEARTVLQTLFKIIRNVLEHPNDIKFRKLRKANPAIQRNVASCKAAMEILFLIGFNEDVVRDDGREETYLVLKRNDPGLLWLAKSSLETCIAF